MGAQEARQRRRLGQLGGLLALAAAIVVVIVIASGGGSGSDTPALRSGETVAGSRDAAARFAGIAQDGTTLGDPRAPVTLVEFADLQCPFCRDYTASVLPTIVDKYVRPGKVKLEFRNVTFIGTDSIRAGQMAEAVGLQNRLWGFIDVFYANQGSENSGYVTDDFLRRIAGAVPGVDVQRALDERGAPAVDRLLTDATNEWQASGMTYTPAFLLGSSGGTLAPFETREITPEAFSRALDDAIARAR
jgi:protein-disulfide isomerase